MDYTTTVVRMPDGMDIHLHQWTPQNPNKTMLLVHGAVEHAKRYEYIASKLTGQGFVVIAPDHRGHGLTAQASGQFSHFADENGFSKVVNDLEAILDYINIEYPNLPRAVFGHSLGSFLVRKFISIKGDDFKAAVLSGTSWGNTIELEGGIVLAKIWSLFTDKNKPNQKFDDFLWGQLNKKVKNRKGTLDFINSDEKEVEKYVADPLNGNTITIEFGIQMSKAILEVRKDTVFSSTPDNLGIYLASGVDDPLSNKGKDINLIAKKYQSAGVKDVTVKLYKGTRHEIINEPIKDEVIADMLNWLKEYF